ncbi:DDB1- and CUL4-associated factor 8-like [Trichogramma pretiosum]|uniref:DDB1- and CUL4-associated factor 8-like n=1 Tax=Trichogramma pretiosum TaxID=7493 RepID=UPI0006C93D24|nr:DDB1- and CUL4-associated factor 8-like [Trichogramma pretiosum]
MSETNEVVSEDKTDYVSEGDDSSVNLTNGATKRSISTSEGPSTSSEASKSADNHKKPKLAFPSFRKLDSSHKNRNYRSQNQDEEVENEETSVESVPPPASNDTANSSPARNADASEDPSSPAGDTNDSVNSSESENDGSSPEHSVDDPHTFFRFASDFSDTANDAVPEVLKKLPSKSNWNLAKGCFDQQIGCDYNINKKFYGSLYAVQHLKLHHKLEDHDGCVNALDFNPKGDLLVSASDDLTIVVWDWHLGKKKKAYRTNHSSNVFQSKWLPTVAQTKIVTAARDGQVRIIDLPTGVTKKLAQHKSACHKICTFDECPHHILSASEDARVLSIDVRSDSPEKLLVVKHDDQPVELDSIHVNPTNTNEFCVAGRFNSVHIYDVRNVSRPKKILCPTSMVTNKYCHITCATYNYNGTEILASYSCDDIHLFDLEMPDNGDCAVHRYEGHRNHATIKGVNFFGPKSEFVLSGSDDGHIYIWDKKTEAIVKWMNGDVSGVVNVLEPHPTLPVLATSGLDHDVKIWIPSEDVVPDTKKALQVAVKKNISLKARPLSLEDDSFDGRMLWIMLRQLNTHPGMARELESDDENQYGGSNSSNSDSMNDRWDGGNDPYGYPAAYYPDTSDED